MSKVVPTNTSAYFAYLSKQNTPSNSTIETGNLFEDNSASNKLENDYLQTKDDIVIGRNRNGSISFIDCKNIESLKNLAIPNTASGNIKITVGNDNVNAIIAKYKDGQISNLDEVTEALKQYFEDNPSANPNNPSISRKDLSDAQNRIGDNNELVSIKKDPSNGQITYIYEDKDRNSYQTIYDSSGKIIKQLDMQSGNHTAYCYYENGNIQTSTTKADGNICVSSYDKNGNIIKDDITDKDGLKTTNAYLYNSDNVLVQKNIQIGDDTKISEHYKPNGELLYTTSNFYSGNALVKSITKNADGNEITKTYDGDTGNLIQKQIVQAINKKFQITTSRYRSDGTKNTEVKELADGSKIYYQYDTDGKLIATTTVDAEGKTTISTVQNPINKNEYPEITYYWDDI